MNTIKSKSQKLIYRDCKRHRYRASIFFQSMIAFAAEVKLSENSRMYSNEKYYFSRLRLDWRCFWVITAWAHTKICPKILKGDSLQTVKQKTINCFLKRILHSNFSLSCLQNLHLIYITQIKVCKIDLKWLSRQAPNMSMKITQRPEAKDRQ